MITRLPTDPNTVIITRTAIYQCEEATRSRLDGIELDARHGWSPEQSLQHQDNQPSLRSERASKISTSKPSLILNGEAPDMAGRL